MDGAAGQDEQKQVVVKIKMNENENKRSDTCRISRWTSRRLGYRKIPNVTHNLLWDFGT